jgi:hypothetical protein
MGLCGHFPPQASNTYCLLLSNGTGYPKVLAAQERGISWIRGVIDKAYIEHC